MKESGVQLGIGSTSYVEGAKVSVNKVAEADSAPVSETAIHEAEHVVAAKKNGTGVRLVTVIPGPGYNGLTQLDRFDPVAAAAPHGRGRRGTGWDIYLVGAMGHNVGSASKTGSNIVEANPHLVNAVAKKLDANKTLDGFDVDEAMRKAEEDRRKQEVEIIFEMPDGTRQKIEKQKAENGIVVFERKWLPEPKKQEKASTSQHEEDLVEV